MIRSIDIKNIQSHKDTHLELSAGINAIVGSSNNGKSAILRGLYWVVYNRPLGTDTLLSHWAVDKKGNQIEPMEVTVENDKGVVTRRRTKTQNQYIVNNDELNVVKTDIPEQVSNVLLLSDTNIQRQQDAPFLLSLTSGQVAQYFNKTVRLDIIDKVLSNAENKRRKTMQDVNQTEELLHDFEGRHEKYNWLDGVQKLLIKYDDLTGRIEQNKSIIETLREQIKQFNEYRKLFERHNAVINEEKTVDEFFNLQNKIKEVSSEINFMNDTIQNFQTYQKKTYPSFERQETLIKKLFSIQIDSISEEKEELSAQLQDYDEYCKIIQIKEKEITELKKQLPNICPLCGNVMKNGVCENE